MFRHDAAEFGWLVTGSGPGPPQSLAERAGLGRAVFARCSLVSVRLRGSGLALLDGRRAEDLRAQPVLGLLPQLLKEGPRVLQGAEGSGLEAGRIKIGTSKAGGEGSIQRRSQPEALSLRAQEPGGPPQAGGEPIPEGLLLATSRLFFGGFLEEDDCVFQDLSLFNSVFRSDLRDSSSSVNQRIISTRTEKHPKWI